LVEVAELTAALERCLKTWGMTHLKLAPLLGLSVASAKHLSSSGGCTP